MLKVMKQAKNTLLGSFIVMLMCSYVMFLDHFVTFHLIYCLHIGYTLIMTNHRYLFYRRVFFIVLILPGNIDISTLSSCCFIIFPWPTREQACSFPMPSPLIYPLACCAEQTIYCESVNKQVSVHNQSRLLLPKCYLKPGSRYQNCKPVLPIQNIDSLE